MHLPITLCLHHPVHPLEKNAWYFGYTGTPCHAPTFTSPPKDATTSHGMFKSPVVATPSPPALGMNRIKSRHIKSHDAKTTSKSVDSDPIDSTDRDDWDVMIQTQDFDETDSSSKWNITINTALGHMSNGKGQGSESGDSPSSSIRPFPLHVTWAKNHHRHLERFKKHKATSTQVVSHLETSECSKCAQLSTSVPNLGGRQSFQPGGISGSKVDIDMTTDSEDGDSACGCTCCGRVIHVFEVIRCRHFMNFSA